MGRKDIQYDNKRVQYNKRVQSDIDARRCIAKEFFKPRTQQEWQETSLCFYEVTSGIKKSWCEECCKAHILMTSDTAKTRTDYKPCDHYLDTFY